MEKTLWFNQPGGGAYSYGYEAAPPSKTGGFIDDAVMNDGPAQGPNINNPVNTTTYYVYRLKNAVTATDGQTYNAGNLYVATQPYPAIESDIVLGANPTSVGGGIQGQVGDLTANELVGPVLTGTGTDVSNYLSQSHTITCYRCQNTQIATQDMQDVCQSSAWSLEAPTNCEPINANVDIGPIKTGGASVSNDTLQVADPINNANVLVSDDKTIDDNVTLSVDDAVPTDDNVNDDVIDDSQLDTGMLEPSVMSDVMCYSCVGGEIVANTYVGDCPEGTSYSSSDLQCGEEPKTAGLFGGDNKTLMYIGLGVIAYLLYTQNKKNE